MSRIALSMISSRCSRIIFNNNTLCRILILNSMTCAQLFGRRFACHVDNPVITSSSSLSVSSLSLCGEATCRQVSRSDNGTPRCHDSRLFVTENRVGLGELETEEGIESPQSGLPAHSHQRTTG